MSRRFTGLHLDCSPDSGECISDVEALTRHGWQRVPWPPRFTIIDWRSVSRFAFDVYCWLIVVAIALCALGLLLGWRP